MKEKLVKTLDLKNGLQLKIYDASRNLVGDRWLVCLIARMEVPVAKVLEKDDPKPEANPNEIRDLLGDRVIFEQKRERIFVDIKEKETVFKEVYDMFLGSTLEYLAKETFPKHCILKKYKEQIKKASLSMPDKNME
jgi:hypothetical protein